MFKFNRSALPCDLELVKHSEQHSWVKRNQRASMFSIFKSRVLFLRTVIIYAIWLITTVVYYSLIAGFRSGFEF